MSLRQKVDALARPLADAAEAAVREGDQLMTVYLTTVERTLSEWSAGRVTAERLTVQQRDRSIKGVEHSAETREALSRRFSRGKNPNMDAARAAGIPSLRALAKALGFRGASFLSQIAAGDRPMPADKAAAFKKLTGKDWQ